MGSLCITVSLAENVSANSRAYRSGGASASLMSTVARMFLNVGTMETSTPIDTSAARNLRHHGSRSAVTRKAAGIFSPGGSRSHHVLGIDRSTGHEPGRPHRERRD